MTSYAGNSVGDKLFARLVKAYVAVMADSEKLKVDPAEALDFFIIRIVSL